MLRVSFKVTKAMTAVSSVAALLCSPALGAKQQQPPGNGASTASPVALTANVRSATSQYRAWLPKAGKPRLVLFCIHALGLSSKSYDNFGRRMAASGIPTYALDVRGFGQWTKQAATAELDFPSCLADVEHGLKTLHKAYPGIPVFLVGESMGGAIAIQAASRYPDLVNGLITAVPSSEERAGSMKSGLWVAFRTAENPTAKVDLAPVVVDGITTDASLRKKMNAEPLNRMELSKKELAQFEKFMKETHDAAPLIERTPVIMLVAYKDKLVTPGGSVLLFSEMTTPRKLMVGDGNSEHLMLEEAQMTPQISGILQNWLKEQSSQRSQTAASSSK